MAYVRNMISSSKFLQSILKKNNSFTNQNAVQVENQARNIGLNVSYGKPTPSDGNCFYHAVIQQYNERPSVKSHIPTNFCNDHLTLRHNIVNFVRENEYKYIFIQNYRQHYESVLFLENKKMSWSDFLNEQQKNGTYATELFIEASAIFLGIEIRITSTHSTPQNQYFTFHPISQLICNIENQSHVYMLIGNIRNVHFQSLIPEEDISTTQFSGLPCGQLPVSPDHGLANSANDLNEKLISC